VRDTMLGRRAFHQEECRKRAVPAACPSSSCSTSLWPRVTCHVSVDSDDCSLVCTAALVCTTAPVCMAQMGRPRAQQQLVEALVEPTAHLHGTDSLCGTQQQPKVQQPQRMAAAATHSRPSSSGDSRARPQQPCCTDFLQQACWQQRGGLMTLCTATAGIKELESSVVATVDATRAKHVRQVNELLASDIPGFVRAHVRASSLHMRRQEVALGHIQQYWAAQRVCSDLATENHAFQPPLSPTNHPLPPPTTSSMPACDV
jgi:hypothetical protein